MRFLLSFIVVALLSGTALAQSKAISPSIGVSPALVRKTIQPGTEEHVKIKLTNYGADPIPMGIAKASIERINDQGSPEFTTRATPRSAADWVNPSINDTIVPANGTKEVEVTIKPPTSVAPGGYNTVLLFQAKLPSYYFDLDANARVLPALFVSFLLSVPSANPITVADLKIDHLAIPRVVLSSPVPLVSQIKNPTNFYVFPDGELTLDPTFGGVKTVSKLSNTILLPESTRQYINAYTGTLLPGFYTATLRLTENDKVLVASARFFALPWPFLIGLIGLLFVLFFLGARRRLRLAYRALRGEDLGKRSPTLR